MNLPGNTSNPCHDVFSIFPGKFILVPFPFHHKQLLPMATAIVKLKEVRRLDWDKLTGTTEVN